MEGLGVYALYCSQPRGAGRYILALLFGCCRIVHFNFTVSALDREGIWSIFCAILCFNKRNMKLTETGVASHSPGEGANLSSILWPPQTLQLGKFTGRTDERAQALRGDWRSDWIKIWVCSVCACSCIISCVTQASVIHHNFIKWNVYNTFCSLLLKLGTSRCRVGNTALTYLYIKWLQTHLSH